VANHSLQASILDQPLAGLLKDLRRRGLLDDTLVVWVSMTSSAFTATSYGTFTPGTVAPGRVAYVYTPGGA